MDFKRQTNRSTKMDRTTNINLFVGNGLEISVLNSVNWGRFKRTTPKIEIFIDDVKYEFTVEEFKKIVKG